jgi:transcriptional regulator with XRE-family HTH domain
MTAEQLKHLRATLGLSQSELARQLGYNAPSSYQIISRWENSTRKIPLQVVLLLSTLQSK